MDNKGNIQRAALSFVTQQEIPGNQGWVDKRFEEMMKITGWKKTQSWCAYFVELVLITANLKEHAAVLSAGAVQSWANCKASHLFQISNTPSVGDLVYWQSHKNGRPSWMGHAGVVVAVQGAFIVTVEGNTNVQGMRDGQVVGLKIRDPKACPNAGLNVLGFCTPICLTD